ncbi:N-acetyltaurine hydrolase [Dermacentor andersoni]|uniref:N-acetyltaurine hydrolase n=1 Tax=Dermacentor andersoni TaxID=34620 RepID=UPI00215554D3|nr:phosphotriesterase-related protein-like [Dermacentor andersoni]
MKGKALTVLGPVEPSVLGPVLTHEHISDTLDDRVFLSGPSELHHAEMSSCSMALENLWWIRHFPYNHPENLRFHGADVDEAVLAEMRFLRSNGGGALVENTCRGIGRNVPLMRRVARETGLHIIAGTGYYVSANYGSSVLTKSVEELEREFIADITDGADGTESRCGVLGELGCTWPLHEFEVRVLRAAASVQQSTGCPAIIHPGRNPQAPAEIARIFAEAGGKLRHTVMSHLERTILDTDALVEFAQSYGCYCEHDLFGLETSHYQPAPSFSMPSDAQRLVQLKRLVDEGFVDRIVVSHDIHTRHRLMKYGGHGYSHVLLNVVPAMLRRGFSADAVRAITQTNPQTWLTFW